MKFKDNAFEILEKRGFIKEVSHLKETKEMLKKPITFYLGIDPTADNLHIGHFFALQMFRILQDCGHRGVLLLGGSTAMIGDPSFKSDMRKMLSQEEVDKNLEEIKKMLPNFIKTTGENAAIIVNNKDWMSEKNYIDFLRDVGTHFNINKMLACDCYKKRLGNGLTFLEMGYMLIQAFDFVHINNEFGAILQIGGSDQWANILAGVDLSRKICFENGQERPLMTALCCPLLTNANGDKMGKTEKGTLWVAREKTSVFDFFQHFVNCLDADVERLLRFFTNIEVEKIINMCKSDIVAAKKTMAFEVTKLVHGEEEAKKAKEAAEDIFNNKNTNNQNMPTQHIKLESNKINIIEFLNMLDLIKSKSEARRLIEQNGIEINGIKKTDVNEILILEKETIIKKGKKTFVKVILS